MQVGNRSKGREHIIPDSLGGHKKLPKRAVCDPCNQGALHALDDAVAKLGIFRSLRPFFGFVGSRRKNPTHVAKGIRFDRQESLGIIDLPTVGGSNSRVEARLAGPPGHRGPPGSAGTIKLTLALGDILGKDNPVLARSVHKWAYNAIAFEHGPRHALRHFDHLRRFVLGLVTGSRPVGLRLDEKKGKAMMGAPGPRRHSHFILEPAEQPETARFYLGPIVLNVATTRDDRPLRLWAEHEEGVTLIEPLGESPRADQPCPGLPGTLVLVERRGLTARSWLYSRRQRLILGVLTHGYRRAVCSVQQRSSRTFGVSKIPQQ